MPQSTVEIPHLAFTHHRIGIHRATAAAPTEKIRATGLVPILATSHLPKLDAQRLLGLAYWRHHAEGDNARLPAARQKAAELLRDAARQGLYDASLATALAGLALQENDATQAKSHAERALADPAISSRDKVQASELLAAIYVQENRLAEATKLLDQLVLQRPHPQYWFLLGVCRQRQGDIAGAIQALERVVAIDPTEPATHRALSPLYQLQGDAEAARKSLARAEIIAANLPK
jgi:tetratricopeptide (TPR) repeat protein